MYHQQERPKTREDFKKDKVHETQVPDTKPVQKSRYMIDEEDKNIQKGSTLDTEITKAIAEMQSDKSNDFVNYNETNREPLYVPPDLSKEALLTDVTIRGIVAHLDELSTRTGHEIQKSKELAESWKEHIIAIDKYIKSLQQWPWKKMVTASICLLAIGGFLYKMAAWRMLPGFASNLISLAPTSLLSKPSQDIPKPNIEKTFNAFMETPLTPITILTCVGGLTISLGILKTLVWVARKIPK